MHLLAFTLVSLVLICSLTRSATCDMMRKSIVFDIKTPKVFYCPQSKPKNMEKLIVRAVPLDKLCEFNGQDVPSSYESDCYNDIDETDYACAEKQRIMLRINPPKDSEATTMIPSPDAPQYIVDNKKQVEHKKSKSGKSKSKKH